MKDVKVHRAEAPPVGWICPFCHKEIPFSWAAYHLYSVHDCEVGTPVEHREAVFAGKPDNAVETLRHTCPICLAVNVVSQWPTLEALKDHIEKAHKN